MLVLLVVGCAYRQPPPLPTTPSRQPTADEIVKLKKVYAKHLRRLAKFEEASARLVSVDALREAAQRRDDTKIRRYAIRQLALHDDPATQDLLKRMVATADNVEQFLAACALAYQGHEGGIEILRKTLSPSHAPISTSGFELSEAGMALAILGYELPPSFAKRVNPYFSELDKLFE
ncbi:MAG: HEAT repeat domain-containing protein [Acidobacteriota bacterium]